MREIKFRVWDTENKKFQYVSQYVLTYNSKSNFILKCQEQENQVWQQYTGLKDKNGKEVYEGDIVKDLTCYSDLYETQGLFENNRVIIPLLVSWIAPEAKFGLLGDFNLVDMDYKYSDQLHSRTLEVIGNIYENPELIKGE